MQKHESQRQSGNIATCNNSLGNWPTNCIHLTKIDLKDSNPDLTEPPDNSTVKESEEKSELNCNRQTKNPDCQLPHNVANLKFKPGCKHHHKIISSEHIDPKMGHLKRTHLAANSKPKDWTEVILQHPQACNQRPKDQTDTQDTIWDSGASACITNDKKDFTTPIKKMQNCKANGIRGAMAVTRSGKVRWSLINTVGEL